MRRFIVIFTTLALFIFTVPAGAQNYAGQKVMPVDGNALDYEKLTAMTSATGITASKLSSGSGLRAYQILVYGEVAKARCTWWGTNPTVSTSTGIGIPWNAGDSFMIAGYDNISRFKCINDTASNGAEIRIVYYYE